MAESQLGEVDKDLFLEAIRQYRCLWDINTESYKERNAKLNAWRELAHTFGHDGSSVGIAQSSHIHCIPFEQTCRQFQGMVLLPIGTIILKWCMGSDYLLHV